MLEYKNKSKHISTDLPIDDTYFSLPKKNLFLKKEIYMNEEYFNVSIFNNVAEITSR